MTRAVLASWTFDPWLVLGLLVLARGLRARVARAAAADARPLPGLAAGVLPGRPRDPARRGRVAARRLRRSAAPGAHGAAPAADDGGAAAAAARSAAGAAAARTAGASWRRTGRPVPRLARAAPRVARGSLTRSSAGPRSPLATWLWHLPGALPARAAVPGLARGRARDVPRRRPALLVAGGAAVAAPRALAALDDPALPAAGGRPEHGLRRLPHLLGARALSRVRRGAAPRRSVRARRPGGGGRDHVGACLADLPRAGRGHHGAGAVASRVASDAGALRALAPPHATRSMPLRLPLLGSLLRRQFTPPRAPRRRCCSPRPRSWRTASSGPP